MDGRGRKGVDIFVDPANGRGKRKADSLVISLPGLGGAIVKGTIVTSSRKIGHSPGCHLVNCLGNDSVFIGRFSKENDVINNHLAA